MRSIYRANKAKNKVEYLEAFLDDFKLIKLEIRIRTKTDKMKMQTSTEKEQRRHNTGLAKMAVWCSANTFVVNQSLVLRINICGENCHLRQARNRQTV